VPALGRWSAEQALPLPKTAFPGKTVVLIGDDDSGRYGGQVAMYVSDAVGDLQSGRLYVLTRTDGNTREMDMKVGTAYPVAFTQIPNQQTLTGAQINQQAEALKAIAFGRVEDLDYRKEIGAGREVYFNVTGQANSGSNADYSRSKYGRVYKLTLDSSDPTRGTLEVVLDGDDRSGPARTFQNPDNIVATRNFLYVQEDPNGYGDETHDGYIYQYNLLTKELKVVLELDHRRDKPDAAKYNVGGPSSLGSWESSGMIDISEQTGEPGTFLVGVQAHTWTGARYKGVDGGALRANEDQASQLLILKGLAR
jgi:secreted PhoX family phosphatase